MQRFGFLKVFEMYIIIFACFLLFSIRISNLECLDIVPIVLYPH